MVLIWSECQTRITNDAMTRDTLSHNTHHSTLCTVSVVNYLEILHRRLSDATVKVEHVRLRVYRHRARQCCPRSTDTTMLSACCNRRHMDNTVHYTSKQQKIVNQVPDCSALQQHTRLWTV